MTHLNGSQFSQLRDLRLKGKLWKGCPPEGTLDADLRYFIDQKLVRWAGDGYVLTDSGYKALEIQP